MVGYADKEKRKNEEKKNFFVSFLCVCVELEVRERPRDGWKDVELLGTILTE